MSKKWKLSNFFKDTQRKPTEANMDDKEKEKRKFRPTSIYRLEWSKVPDLQKYLADNFKEIKLNRNKDSYEFEIRFYTRQTESISWLVSVMEYFIEDRDKYIKTYTKDLFVLTAVNKNQKLKSAFAICTGHVYRKLLPYVDMGFSFSVGKKILSPKNVRQAKSRFLHGSTVCTDKSFHADKKGRNLPSITSDIFFSVDGFQAQVADRLKGDLFSQIKSASIVIKRHSLKIMKSISLNDMFNVLADLSCVYDKGLHDKKDFDFLDYVVQVKDRKRKRKLDECLEHYLRNSREDDLEGFFLCPENYEEWQKCEKVRLYEQKRKEKKTLHEWFDPPSILNVVKLLQNKSIPNIRMSYKISGHWRFGGKILNCIQGQVLRNRKHYFHLGKEWYTVHGEYIRKMDKEFFLLLKDKLITKLEDGTLPLPWCSESDKRLAQKDHVDQYIQFCKGVLRTKLSVEQLQEIRRTFPSGTVMSACQNTTTTDRKSVTNVTSNFEFRASRGTSNVTSTDDNNGYCSSEGNTSTTGIGKKRRNVGTDIPASPIKKIKLMSSIEEKVEYKLYAECFKEIDENKYNEAYYLLLNQVLHGNPNCDLSIHLRVDPESKFPNFLLGDSILVQNHTVELFDLLKITKDKLYLYHVKATFGQMTRDAVSQIRDSASLLYKAVLGRDTKILGEWYDTVVNYHRTKKIKAELRRDLRKCGRRDFINLFLEKKIVYVYAFLDGAKQRKSFADLVSNGQWLLLTEKHIRNALGVEKGKEKVKALCDVLKSNQIISDTDGGFKVQKEFENYKRKDLLQILRHRDKFFEERFEAIFNTLQKHFVPTVLIRSHIAKFELLRLAHDFKNEFPLFELKLCQIKKPWEEITL